MLFIQSNKLDSIDQRRCSLTVDVNPLHTAGFAFFVMEVDSVDLSPRVLTNPCFHRFNCASDLFVIALHSLWCVVLPQKGN